MVVGFVIFTIQSNPQASSNGASSSSSTWGVLMSHSLQMFHRFSSLSNVQLFTERLDMLIPEASFPEVGLFPNGGVVYSPRSLFAPVSYFGARQF